MEEDVWIGARVTLLAGSHIGRGAVVGANTLVNKEIPPYAVVVGSPAKIIAAKFTIDQIMEHERILYPEKKRFTKEYLEELFNQYYTGKRRSASVATWEKQTWNSSKTISFRILVIISNRLIYVAPINKHGRFVK